VEIRRSEILRVEERPGVGLRVLTLNRDRKIDIPVSVERFAEVRAHLSNWRVLEMHRPRTVAQRWPTATWVTTAVAGVLALTIVIRAEDALVVVPAGLLLLAGGGWGMYEIQRSPYLDRRIKWTSWLGLVGLAPVAEKVVSAILR
jgi:hypothetical protein